jgi:hypothetical protein
LLPEQPSDNQENPPEELSSQSPAALVQAFISSLGHSLRRKAYSHWPSLFNDPDLQCHLAYWTDRDTEENSRSAPTVGESIEVHALWVVEVYPPSFINGLFSGLKALGWDNEDLEPLGYNPVQWLQHLRLRSTGPAQFNLGPIVRRDSKSFGKRTAPLPRGIDYALAQIHYITSAITSVVVVFVFTAEVAQQYDAILRRPRTTFSEKYGRGYRIHGPSQQKWDDIRTTRNHMRAQCADWFRSNLPGLFSSGFLNRQFPSCEFLTLHEQIPFPPSEAGSRPPEYLHLLGIAHDIDAWVSDDLPGFRLGIPMFPEQDEEFQFILAAKDADIPDKATLGYGVRKKDRYVNYLQTRIDALLVRWAASVVVEGYERMINRTRDAIPRDPMSMFGALNFLDSLQKLTNASIDLVAVCSDLVNFTQHPALFTRDVGHFRPANQTWGSGETTLGESLRQRIAERATSLPQADDRVRQLRSQYGTVQSTIVNLKLQRCIKRLTWFMLFLTAVTVVISLESVFHFLHGLLSRL